MNAHRLGVLLAIHCFGYHEKRHMAKILLGSTVGDIRGSVGAGTFSKGRNGAILRQKVSPVQPRTSSVLLQRSKFADNSKVWTGPTMDGLREGWLALAAIISKTNVFGNSYKLTGSQLFKSCNMNLDAIGKPHITIVPDNLDVVSLLTLSADGAAASAAVITAVDASTSSATYLYSSHTGLVPKVGMQVTISGFATGGNNVTGRIIAASGGASGSFVLPLTTQADETHSGAMAGTGFSVGFTATPLDADSALVIQASPQMPAGRSFFGSGAKQVVATALAAASPVDITTAYAALFGGFRSGSKVQVKAFIVNSVNGAASTPISVTTTIA